MGNGMPSLVAMDTLPYNLLQGVAKQSFPITSLAQACTDREGAKKVGTIHTTMLSYLLLPY